MENEYVCRTCLQIFNLNSVVHLNATEDETDSISLRLKLQACVPELTVDIVHDPVICETCCAAIILAYQFKSSCLENEKTLYNFIRQRKQNPYDLITVTDLLKIVRKDINEEHSYSFVEKFYTNGHISDSDSDTEISHAKLSTAIKASLQDVVNQALAGNPHKNVVGSEQTQETSYSALKTKVKSNQVKEVVENEDSVKSTISFNSFETVDDVKEAASSSRSESINKSVNIKNKRAICTKKGSSLKAINIPEDPDVTESGSKLPKRKIKRKQRKQIRPKRNLLHDTNRRGSRSFTKKIESQEKSESDVSMNSRQSATAKKLLTNEKIITMKLSKSEIQNDPKINRNEDVPSQNTIKKSSSDRDTRNTSNGSIDNDLVEINQMILKNDLSELPKLSCYQKDNKRYRCTKCNKGYNFKSHFDIHLKSHIFKKLYTCPICLKDFAQEKYLKSHALLHTGAGLYQCDICFKSLSASTALKRHYTIHTGEKPHVCACCNKMFAQKIQLAVHMRTHTGYRPYACHECKAEFTQKSHLLGHMRIHTGEKPYKCDQCPKSFRKSYALQVHKHSHSVKPFQCGVCNFLLKDAGTFQRHVNKHLVSIANGGNHVLRKPKSKRKMLGELEQDIKDINIAASLLGSEILPREPKAYLYHCSVCSRGFSTNFSMKRHAKVHGKITPESPVF